MIEHFFSENICNANNAQCNTRGMNLDTWQSLYVTKKGEYLSALEEYLKKKLDTTSTSAGGAGELAAKKQVVENTYNNLNSHLEELKTHNETISTSLSSDAVNIGNNEHVINSNNARIMYQDKDINKLNISLISKERQIAYTTERNRNRRIMIAALIIVNIILLSLAYYMYTNN